MNKEVIKMNKRRELNDKIRKATLKIVKPSMKDLIKEYVKNSLYIIFLIVLCVLYVLCGGAGIIIPYLIR